MSRRDPPAPRSRTLERHPELDTWIAIERDGTVVVRTGKVELGQGLVGAIARIAAEELDVALERVRVETADTARGPMELYTVGSNSLEESGSAVRQAAAEARQYLLELAARELSVPVGRLVVDDGVVSAPGSERRTSYAALLGGRRFDRRITGEARPKPPGEHRIVGRPAPRIDLRAKLTGGAFLCDLRPPGLLHGRVARPPGPHAQLAALDEAALRDLPGVVAVVRDGSFLGVVAEREEQAVRAREALLGAARWREGPELPPEDALADWLRGQPRRSFPVVDGRPADAPVPEAADPPGATHTLSARYSRPYQMHASLGPSAALAHFEPGGLRVWSHSQGVTVLRAALADALGLERDRVRVTHAPGAGCYGHNGAEDAAFDACLLARAVPGRPVLLQWTREDEHAWEPYAPAMCVELRGSLDARGRICAWSHESYSNSHMGRPLPGGKRSAFVAAAQLARPFAPQEPEPRLEPEAGIHRNATPVYALPSPRVVKHYVEPRPLRVSSTRGLGAFANVFAIESFMDELAHAAGADPVRFRLDHLDDERGAAVLRACAARAGERPLEAGCGRGFGFARYKNEKAYAAIAVDARVEPDAGRIHLLRAVIAADAGQVVDPDGLANQLEGGFVQAASWTLLERVRFSGSRITSTDWESYPILCFPDVPEIETLLIDRPDQPFLGAGEASVGPAAAAIANAVFAACGVRLRDLPLALPPRPAQ